MLIKVEKEFINFFKKIYICIKVEKGCTLRCNNLFFSFFFFFEKKMQ